MEENKYERMLAQYNTNINDEEVARKVKRIVEDGVEENNTLDVKKFLFGSIELTSLKATDSDESILKLVENVN
ncbi:MAG: deoxyribose-phosphate aldolase, partial [Bacteroidaceae bacterium]|nr:deoxyribose-phosphate aldolase [Bacteroidaceae bacterium]